MDQNNNQQNPAQGNMNETPLSAPSQPIPTQPQGMPTPVTINPPVQESSSQTQPVQTQAQAEITSMPAPVAQSSSSECGCPIIDAAQWDKQQKQLDKTFYQTFSPRILFKPFSWAIDLDRATRAAKKAGYTVPQNPMILDSAGMFWAKLLLEVNGAQPGDKNIVSLAGKNLYTKVSTRPWSEMKIDLQELETELGKKPQQVYCWWTACPKCIDQKEIKTVFIAII